MSNIPLTHESSLKCQKTKTGDLPSDVVQSLQNSRFLHLATCANNIPHISLMNYTYIPASDHEPPRIIMTSNPESIKTTNIAENPAVSLLVHDWISPRPPQPNPSSSPPKVASALASMLLSLNTSSISSISATISGSARILTPGIDEEKKFWDAHIANHKTETGEDQETFGNGDVRVVVVDIKGVRISDWKGGVRDFDVGN